MINLILNDATISMHNFIDDWFIKLQGKFNGLGMVLFVFLTLIISVVLSALIGLERYRAGKDAGMGTHALLSVGCSFLMTISIWGIRTADPTLDYDISRIAAAAVAGIGFLGAGVIIKDRFTVKGLSTATTLWICSAIGLATGAGFVLEAVVATVVTMLVVLFRNKVIGIVDRNAPRAVVTAKKGCEVVEKIIHICTVNGFNLRHISISEITDTTVTVNAYFPYHVNPLTIDYVLNEIKKDADVVGVQKVMKEN